MILMYSVAEAIHVDPAGEGRGERRRDRGSELQRHRLARTHVAYSQSSRKERSLSVSGAGPVRRSLLQCDLYQILPTQKRHFRPLHLR